MASVNNLTLAIAVVTNGPNLEANVTVDYDIVFSSYDQDSNQPYTEVCRLIGDDSGQNPPEDGQDDSIPGGQLFPVLILPPLPAAGPIPAPVPIPIPIPLLNTIASDGRPSVHRTHSKTLPLSALNEDQGTVPNPDEIRAQVTITPVAPATVVRESNQVALNL
jgi:hypothetical protein